MDERRHSAGGGLGWEVGNVVMRNGIEQIYSCIKRDLLHLHCHMHKFCKCTPVSIGSYLVRKVDRGAITYMKNNV